MKNKDVFKIFIAAIVTIIFTALSWKDTSGQDCEYSVCEQAVSIGCTEFAFENHGCDHVEYNCIFPHPWNGACCNPIQAGRQWFAYYNYDGGPYVMSINTNFSNNSSNHGAKWWFSKGHCDSLMYLAYDACPSRADHLYCVHPSGNFIYWAGAYDEPSPCSEPDTLFTYWHDLGIYPHGTWTPYDPTQQNHEMHFWLEANTQYYIAVGGFLAADDMSYGEGTISICPEQPLSSKPVLKNDGLLLQWTGYSSVEFTLFQYDQIGDNGWEQIGRTEENNYQLHPENFNHHTEYFIVAASDGFSNALAVRVHKTEDISKFDVLGREHVKFGIKRE